MGPIVLASCVSPPIQPEDDPILLAALQDRGCSAGIRPWTDIDPGALAPGSAVVLRSTWDYHLDTERFLNWLSALQAANCIILNSPSLIRLTIDKSFLMEMNAPGCVVPATICLPSTADAVTSAVRARGWNRFVVKPLVSSGAYRTFLLEAGNDLALVAALAEQAEQVLVQEFLPEIKNGELSLVFFDGRFSHAVRKIPAPDDFRVQPEFGGLTERFQPTPAVIAAARRLLRRLPEIPCYARVDGVMRGRNFLLMELELIEPDLCLPFAQGAAEALAGAILRHIGRFRQLTP